VFPSGGFAFIGTSNQLSRIISIRLFCFSGLFQCFLIQRHELPARQVDCAHSVSTSDVCSENMQQVVR
jgi:hypothetical protein